jgi:hypothetical protein
LNYKPAKQVKFEEKKIVRENTPLRGNTSNLGSEIPPLRVDKERQHFKSPPPN